MPEVFDIENFSKAQVINNMSTNEITFQDASNAIGFDLQNSIQTQSIGNLSNNQFNLLGAIDGFKVMNAQAQSAESAEIIINGMRNNQVLNNVLTSGIMLSAYDGSSIHINIDGGPGAVVPLDILSLVNNNILVQDMKNGGAIVVTEIVG